METPDPDPGSPEFADQMIARMKEHAANEGISIDDWIKRWLGIGGEDITPEDLEESKRTWQDSER